MTPFLLTLACAPGAAPPTGSGPTDTASDDRLPASMIVNPERGDPGITSMHRIAFGPGGYLAIADADNQRLVVVNTGDHEAAEANVTQGVADIRGAVGDALGAGTNAIEIWDVAVNPASKRTWLAVEQSRQGSFALLVLEGDGTLTAFDLSDVEYAVIPYEGSADGSWVFDVAWAGDYLVAGTSDWEWTDNRVVVAPVPVVHNDAANVTGTRTYHRTHTGWETAAPVVTLFPYTADGIDYVGANYTCAPVVRFPVEDLAAGAGEVTGVTPFDFGGGKMVMDFETYSRDGTDYVLASVYGLAAQEWDNPASNGGARVELSLFTQSGEVDRQAPMVFAGGPQEEAQHDQALRIPELDGVVRMSRVDDDRLVVLDATSLRLIPMP